MNHMFGDLSTKYDNDASHMRQMDIQIAQTAESIKRQQVGTSSPGPEQPAEVVCPIPEVVPPREYIPKVPYPVPAKATRKDREEMKCRKMLEDLTVQLPMMDAIQMMPSMRSFMKGLISGKISEESEFMTVSKECSAVLQNRQIKKRGDPGKFVLSIQIGKTVFACSLVDLGSSVNLMPYSVARRLGYTHFKPTKMSLVFADRSVKSPVGILEDLQVKVGNTSVPANFVVLELEEESKDPLILGRPFLCTVGAIIDVRQGKIDLNLGDIVMQFEMDELLKKPMLDGQTFEVNEGIDPLQPRERMIEEILTEDPLELALVRAEAEQSVVNIDADGYAKMLDSARSMERMVASLSLEEASSRVETTPSRATPTPDSPVLSNQPEDPWSELKAPKVELKPLPKGLRYAFLGPNSTYPVIVNAELNIVETALLLCELKKYRKALGYSLADIPGISPDLCMHRIHLEDESTTSVEHQRRLNPNLKDVVKKEIMKLLEAGVIYVISDSKWVSPVHVVPKKGGITVITNEKNELIPTRTIPIHPGDQEKTTFTCPYGTYAYRRMPFGLCNAPATFQRCMMVLKRCEEKHLVLNREKCHFMVTYGIVLGHKISEKGIEVDKAKIKVMMSLNPPTNVKAIRSFLGHAGFYRRFIQDFSRIARPLTRLLCKEIKFDFDSECLAAFHTIKRALVSAHVVQPPDWDLPFEIMTDASDFAVGAVLGQHKDNKLHVIYYASKTMDEAQCRYTTIEKELLAIVIVHTDYAALKYLLTKKDVKPRLLRWILLLQEFDLEIKDKRGVKNGVADHLSRMKTDDDTTLDDEHPVEHVNAIGLLFAEQPLRITSDCSSIAE
ncbi:uncharacterized protein LOC125590622 [Brassica napus]|uniref:uncharacterized protein LOC125590622 n=1 Tax=Brassica napus TaxID=3708 RepID=UPI002079C27F|nr:uncharacterized protein LOC125590622 [Brassica napus]